MIFLNRKHVILGEMRPQMRHDGYECSLSEELHSSYWRNDDELITLLSAICTYTILKHEENTHYLVAV